MAHLSGSFDKALDWGSRGSLFKTQSQGSHCAVFLSKTSYLLLSNGSTEQLLTGMLSIKGNNQNINSRPHFQDKNSGIQ